MPVYYLVDDGRTMPRWCELAHDGGRAFWIDFKGRRSAYGDGRPLAHVEGRNVTATVRDVPDAVADLERAFAEERLLDPWSDQGWLSPSGRFYGCAFFAHDDIAWALLRKGPAQLEDDGWVRVHGALYQCLGARGPTRRQEDVLLKLGFEEDGSGTPRRSRYEPDRSAPPPRFAVQPRGGSRPEQARPDHGTVRQGMERLLARLSAHPVAAALSLAEAEPVDDPGPGIWTWMLRFDGMDLGGEEHPGEIAASEGVYLRATSFDTVEVAAWPFPRVEADRDALRLVASVAAGKAPAVP